MFGNTRRGSAANVYSHGVSEEILGKAIKAYDLPRGKIVVATKLFFLCAEGNPGIPAFGKGQDWVEQEAGYVNGNGLSRKHIFDSVDASLRRLNLDYIDLLQIHRYAVHIRYVRAVEILYSFYVAALIPKLPLKRLWKLLMTLSVWVKSATLVRAPCGHGNSQR